MILYAFDPATVTGWAIFDDSSLVACGVERLGPKGETVGTRIVRLGEMWCQLAGLPWPMPRHVAYERAFGARGHGILLQHALIGEINRLAAIHRCGVHPISATTAKKALTGHGGADKHAMLAAARAQYPNHIIKDHNAADAIAVGLAAIRRIDTALIEERNDP